MLYVRHLGWLHAIPEGSKKSRLASFKAVSEEHTSLNMPDIENEHSAGYLIGLLNEAGLMSSSGMGPVPLSWLEIDAWLRCTELDISVWERLTIKRMSEEYVAERCETDPNRPAPFIYMTLEEKELVEVRTDVNDKIMAMFSFFKKAPDESNTAIAEEGT